MFFQSGERLYNLPELVEKFELSSLKTNSCQINYDWLETFNQKLLEQKLSHPESAKQVLLDAKRGELRFVFLSRFQPKQMAEATIVRQSRFLIGTFIKKK